MKRKRPVLLSDEIIPPTPQQRHVTKQRGKKEMGGPALSLYQADGSKFFSGHQRLLSEDPIVEEEGEEDGQVEASLLFGGAEIADCVQGVRPGKRWRKSLSLCLMNMTLANTSLVTQGDQSAPSRRGTIAVLPSLDQSAAPTPSRRGTIAVLPGLDRILKPVAISVPAPEFVVPLAPKAARRSSQRLSTVGLQNLRPGRQSILPPTEVIAEEEEEEEEEVSRRGVSPVASAPDPERLDQMVESIRLSLATGRRSSRQSCGSVL